ncbi:MAG: hypothetical protein FWE10_08650 [Rikenellaceae bacterium]|nr:hypothetical protein [Rikenellaceae bacterium]MCL2692685.1 hypothetical protein [Rikenellaceae bacterium]
MNHKIKIFVILICSFLSINSQYAQIPNSHRHAVYIDNIFIGTAGAEDIKKIPRILLENYYGEIFVDSLFEPKNPKMIKDIYIEREREDLLHAGSLHIRTKKAKDGYLFVNRKIMDKIASLDCDLGGLQILYVYNNVAVTTKKDVMRLLGLRERRIRISEITYDELSREITVYIFDE